MGNVKRSQKKQQEVVTPLELTLAERIFLGSSLPKKGSYHSLIAADAIEKKLNFSDEEIEKFEIKTVGNSVHFNEKGVKAKFKMEFDSPQMHVLKLTLQSLSQKEELDKSLMNIYKKVCI